MVSAIEEREGVRESKLNIRCYYEKRLSQRAFANPQLKVLLQIVAVGTPEEIAAVPDSFTGQYLSPILNKAQPAPLAAG